ncbi:MAG TPA: hypothetical protein VF691_05775 [Cytophagaceae bacterium]
MSRNTNNTPKLSNKALDRLAGGSVNEYIQYGKHSKKRPVSNPTLSTVVLYRLLSKRIAIQLIKYDLLSDICSYIEINKI